MPSRRGSAADRWLLDEARLGLAVELWTALLGGSGFDLSQVVPDLDVAGLPHLDEVRAAAPDRLPRPERLEVVGLRSVGADWTGAALRDVLWRGCEFTDSKFTVADLSKGSFFACNARDTSFAGANMTKTVIGHRHPGRSDYLRCDFDRVRWPRVLAAGGSFVDCTFRDVKLKDIDFECTSFTGCRFSGSLEDIRFYRSGTFCPDAFVNDMRDCDLAAASLTYVEFRGIDLTGVELPDDDNHILVENFGAGLRAALGGLADAPVKSSVRVRLERELERRLQRAGSGTGRGIIQVNEWRQQYGDAQARKLAAWFRKIASQVGSGRPVG